METQKLPACNALCQGRLWVMLRGGTGLCRTVGVLQRHPAVPASRRGGARVPPNRAPLVRRGRPAAPAPRRGAGNKGGCVRPSRSLARRPDTRSRSGQGFPGRGGDAACWGGLVVALFGCLGFFFNPFFVY